MKINFNRLQLLLLPSFLRKGVLKAFCKAVSVGLQTSKTDTDRFFSEQSYHVRITPQLFSLEKMLNDKCDSYLRRIYISIPQPLPPFYFTTNADPGMKYFGDGEYFTGNRIHTYDFVVYLPTEIKSNDMTNYVTALLNRYKIITKTFKIIYA